MSTFWQNSIGVNDIYYSEEEHVLKFAVEFDGIENCAEAAQDVADMVKDTVTLEAGDTVKAIPHAECDDNDSNRRRLGTVGGFDIEMV